MKRVREEAARWFARMRDAGVDDADRSRFEAWLLSDPCHAAEYEAFARLWGGLDQPARCDAVAEALELQRAERRRLLRRGVVFSLLSGGGLLTAGFVWWRQQPVWQFARATAVGEVAQVKLPDGSCIDLAGDSAIEVVYARGLRMVRLQRGAAVFDVVPDGRGFEVEAGDARVTVLGTRFAVDRLPGLLRVSVDHGRVRVAIGGLWQRRTRILSDGESVDVDLSADAIGFVARGREARDAFAFTQGFLVLDLADLGEVAAELSRYRHEPVMVLPGRAGADPRITAAIRLDDMERFLHNLPHIAAVDVVRENGRVGLRAR